MELSPKEIWIVVHGMILGSIYLLAFTGGLADLWSLKPELLTGQGLYNHLRRLRIGMWLMTVVIWGAVITGTYIVYPWYVEGPATFLAGNPQISEWNTFAMEWKIHVGWIAPILMTCVAFIVTYYSYELIHFPVLRNILIVLFLIAFIAAGIAAVYGTFITKIAPIDLGDFAWTPKKILAK